MSLLSPLTHFPTIYFRGGAKPTQPPRPIYMVSLFSNEMTDTCTAVLRHPAQILEVRVIHEYPLAFKGLTVPQRCLAVKRGVAHLRPVRPWPWLRCTCHSSWQPVTAAAAPEPAPDALSPMRCLAIKHLPMQQGDPADFKSERAEALLTWCPHAVPTA